MNEQVTVLDGEVVSVVEHGAAPRRPATYAAADKVGLRELARSWVEAPAARGAGDELADVAAVRVLAYRLGGEAPAAMHRALRAGADARQVAAAYGAPVVEAAAAWRTWATAQRRRWVTAAPGAADGGITADEYDQVAARWHTATQPHGLSQPTRP